ncbi:hypothetical protein [Arthrobacter sp. MMS18-M83]|uniref:hypothetical protein n=1 Tax=Arthrobacter sp. MMS18-M83 TaxID=2996261 RepID=UPI00227C1B9D|nr:hypothetical protein [Arthrobacter sp. MMS18-M83]WAH97134.1 hypothetical protein OW521_22775 [Arthrobacter sp. MMS18-M83]
MPILTSLAASKAVITMITAGAIAAGGGAAAFTSISTTEAPAPASTASASPSPSAPLVPPTTAVPLEKAPETEPSGHSESAPATEAPAEEETSGPASTRTPSPPAPAPTHASPSSNASAVDPADRDDDGMTEVKDGDAGDRTADHESKGKGQHKPDRAHAEGNSDAGKR